MRRTDDVSLWPWPLTLEVTTIVGHTRPGTLREYQVKILVMLRLFVFDYGPLGQHGLDWSRDLATLTFDFGSHGAYGWCGSSCSITIPILKFVGFAIRKIWRTMCVSINGPSDPDLWPFDLETGVRLASKVENLPSKLGHARPLVSRIIRYVRDGRTKTTLIAPSPTGMGHKNLINPTSFIQDRFY